MVKNLPANAGDMGSIPGLGGKYAKHIILYYIILIILYYIILYYIILYYIIFAKQNMQRLSGRKSKVG